MLEIKEVERQSFEIKDLSSANWCFKKIKSLESKKAEINVLVEEEISIIQEYQKKETEAINNDICHFKNLIQKYVEEREEEDPKFRLTVPFGTASFGKEQIKITYDDKVMLDFVKENNLTEFINETVTQKLNKKEFNNYLAINEDEKVLTADGEILENVFVEKFRNFNIKTK